VMKFIEIVPLTNTADRPEVSDIERHVQIKVSVFSLLSLFGI